MVPTAYTTVAKLGQAIRCSTSVRNNGQYDFHLNSRCTVTQGHELGVGRGTTEAGYLHVAHARKSSDFVFSEGYATCAHGDICWVTRPDYGGDEAQKGKEPIKIAATTKNFKHACNALGIDPIDASDALHAAKEAAGLSPSDNCTFDLDSGDIMFNGESIGNLGD
jgi:hypothetical protein